MLTVPIAPATSQAPAARPVRAAAPAAADSGEPFHAVLARTADRPSATGGGPRPPGEGDSDVDEAPELDEMTDVTAVPLSIEPSVWVMSPVVQPETPNSAEPAVVDAIAAGEEDADDAEIVDTGAGEMPAVLAAKVADEPAPALQAAAKVADESAPALLVAKVADEPVPVILVAKSADEPVPAVGVTPAPGASVSAPAQPVVGSAEHHDRKVVEAAGAAMAAASESASTALERVGSMLETSSPAIEAPRGKVVRTATVEAPTPRTEARSTAQAIVAEALVKTMSTASATATADQTRVATPPLLAGPTPQVPADPGSPPAKTRAAHTPVDVLPCETGEARPIFGQPQTGGREAGHQQAQDHRQSAGRTVALANAAGLPASMTFPGQASFAAAMERALPLAPALPPAFSSPALETVVPQIVRSLHMQVTAGGGDMKLTLTPEHLGTVTIELRVDQQRVAATLGADTPAVRGWIAAHEQDLKAGLADLGLHLDEFVVRDDDPREHREHDGGQQTRHRRRRVKSEDSVFEVDA